MSSLDTNEKTKPPFSSFSKNSSVRSFSRNTKDPSNHSRSFSTNNDSNNKTKRLGKEDLISKYSIRSRDDSPGNEIKDKYDGSEKSYSRNVSKNYNNKNDGTEISNYSKISSQGSTSKRIDSSKSLSQMPSIRSEALSRRGSSETDKRRLVVPLNVSHNDKNISNISHSTLTRSNSLNIENDRIDSISDYFKVRNDRNDSAYSERSYMRDKTASRLDHTENYDIKSGSGESESVVIESQESEPSVSNDGNISKSETQSTISNQPTLYDETSTKSNVEKMSQKSSNSYRRPRSPLSCQCSCHDEGRDRSPLSNSKM